MQHFVNVSARVEDQLLSFGVDFEFAKKMRRRGEFENVLDSDVVNLVIQGCGHNVSLLRCNDFTTSKKIAPRCLKINIVGMLCLKN
jgi:hypothetical protein